jgi:TolB protein
VAASIVLVGTCTAGAEAAYPGANGRIAFLSNPGGERFDLFTMRPDGTDARLVARGASVYSPPSWSPDGRRLVYTTARSRLATVSAANASRRVYPFLGWWGTWSPGGSRIAFENRAGGIDIVAATGGKPRTLIADTGARDFSKWNPSWSPDGTRIAYVSGDGLRRGAIWTIELADGTRRRLTTGDRLGNIDLAPDWSPDGQAIAFQRYLDCQKGTCHSAVFTIPASGGAPRLVARNASWPSWSPDGRQIAFRRRGRSGDIWVMNADGSNARRITMKTASEVHPDWQPRS